MKLLFILIVSLTSLSAQNNHTIMTYNLLNYPGTDTTIRNPHFRTMLSATSPDIIVVQEILSQAGVDGFLNNVLRVINSDYSAGVFNNGPDTDNAVFYKSSFFTFISNTPIVTTLRDINEFKFVHNLTNDTLRLFSVHLKASEGSSNEQQRLAEVTILRNYTDALPVNSNYIVLGDFNIYSANEPAYIKLKEQTTSGYFVDIFNLPGTWNNSSYAQYHTQSPRTRSIGGGATGGMDDRFDMILMSQAIIDVGSITYQAGTYTEYGNDGNHFNDSINRPPNTAVGQQIADALHYASDHLPVIASFTFEQTTVQITVDVNPGWNLLSVPVLASNMTASVLFPGASSSFFSYEGAYQEETVLSNGKGYWARFEQPQSYILTGSFIDSTSISVSNGWNLIGPFSTDIPVNSITTIPPNIIESDFFGYNLGYEQATILLKGKGYWVRTNQSGTLNFTFNK